MSSTSSGNATPAPILTASRSPRPQPEASKSLLLSVLRPTFAQLRYPSFARPPRTVDTSTLTQILNASPTPRPSRVVIASNTCRAPHVPTDSTLQYDRSLVKLKFTKLLQQLELCHLPRIGDARPHSLLVCLLFSQFQNDQPNPHQRGPGTLALFV
ncbi:hypothetical protein FA95DRAFT_1613206 [Auriscalpium vulgare]|uniref:Uncharacterized protein n=1 Tax=Auriscalpium vulgare TaxID=40419 RepID=A0ACB8R466_9AGAM|nr:hypothetical protein FA95DRAFT_1613206 [Auriscalpium vulgare]